MHRVRRKPRNPVYPTEAELHSFKYKLFAREKTERKLGLSEVKVVVMFQNCKLRMFAEFC